MQDIDFNELEEMRSQMALLKNKLDSETIVTNKLIRSAMKDKVKRIRREGHVTYIAAIALTLCMPGMIKEFGISWWLAGYTVLMMAVSAFFTYYYNRGLSPNLMNGNMVDVAKRMRRLRRDYKNWRYIGYPMALAWVVWMFAELSLAHGISRAECIGAAIGVVVGALVGGFIGHRRSQQTMSCIEEIIHDAEEFDNNR